MPGHEQESRLNLFSIASLVASGLVILVAGGFVFAAQADDPGPGFALAVLMMIGFGCGVVVSFVGLACGVIGLARGERKPLATIGVILNVTILSATTAMVWFSAS